MRRPAGAAACASGPVASPFAGPVAGFVFAGAAIVSMALAGCAGAGAADERAPAPTPARPDSARPAAVRAPEPIPAPASPPAFPATFVFTGRLTQGGWIRGQAPAGTIGARLGEQALALDRDGRFFAAFDRDAGPAAQLVAQTADGRTVDRTLAIAPRDWNIEHIDVARTPSGPSAAFMARRRPELARIVAARSAGSAADGWRQDFVWPARGRISGRFGSQRIYRGEPGSYHTGLDIAGGQGTPFVAPAAGVVTLAAETPFSLEGHLIIIDHGHGLNSAFLHASRIDVREGQRVAQGQLLGAIGATGRATGPHLHWSIVWRGRRLDPLLFVPAA